MNKINVMIIVVALSFIFFYFCANKKPNISNGEQILPNDIEKLVVPNGYKLLSYKRVVNDPYFVTNRLLPITSKIKYIQNEPLWPPLLFEDNLFTPAKECANEGDMILLKNRQVCRSIISEKDIGGKEYYVFRYGFENGQTVLFGIKSIRCDFYDVCPHTYHTLDEITETLDHLTASLIK